MVEDIALRVRDIQAILEKLVQGQNIDNVPVEDLIEIAAVFEEHELKDLPSLTNFLESKAEEYVDYKAQIAALTTGSRPSPISWTRPRM